MIRLTIFCALLTISLFAEPSQQLRFFDERLTALEDQVNHVKIYNSSGRAEVADGLNLFLVGEYLYLQPQENGLSFGIKTTNAVDEPDNVHIAYKNLNFKYSGGYRGAIGYNIPHDSWDFYLSWMHYNTHAEGSASVHGDGRILPTWTGLTFDQLPVDVYATHADARLRLNLNIFDADLGREYYVGKWVTLRPSLGVRTAFIHQHYRILYDPLIADLVSLSDLIRLKNEFWGVGPKASIGTQWSLIGGFHLYGSAAFSLLYGHFKTRHREYFSTDDPAPLSAHQNQTLVRAIADLAAGIGWDIMLVHDQYHLSLRAGYEQHLYFGQNQFDQVLYSLFHTTVISNLGDLSLAGWTLSLRVDF